MQPRILLVGPQLILGWTESTARAFESLGCRVSTVFYNKTSLRRRVRRVRQFSARLKIPWPVPHWFRVHYEEWMSGRACRTILQAARTFRPDLVFILKGEILQPGALKELKAVTGALVAAWWVDHPFMNGETGHQWRKVPGCLPLYEHCFVFDHSYDGPLREAGAQSVSFLPCAADSDTFKPEQLTESDQGLFGTAVSLIGVYTRSRSDIVRAVNGVPGLGLWGPGWKELLAGQRNSGSFRGEALTPAQACKVYNASLVNLNTHHPQTRLGGLNTRAFEIPAAGGFELTDYVTGMEGLLEPGREVAVYRSPEEASELARFYVKADGERKRIAEAGHKRVVSEHTYRNRAETVLSTLGL